MTESYTPSHFFEEIQGLVDGIPFVIYSSIVAIQYVCCFVSPLTMPSYLLFSSRPFYSIATGGDYNMVVRVHMLAGLTQVI